MVLRRYLTMAMMYTSEGWVEFELPPFLDLDEICRKQDEEEERLCQEQKKDKEVRKNE
jgi:hypothetical protein